jgi:hypothetical protein
MKAFENVAVSKVLWSPGFASCFASMFNDGTIHIMDVNVSFEGCLLWHP